MKNIYISTISLKKLLNFEKKSIIIRIYEESLKNKKIDYCSLLKNVIRILF